MAATLRKKVARVALACLLALSCFSATSITTLVSAHGDRSVAYAANAWKKSGNRWWYQTGDSYAKGWKQIDGKWYYFDSNGWMQTGWQKIGGTWYYLDNSGVMAADKWVGNYYLTKSGSMATSTWVGNYWVGSDGVWMPNKTKGTWKKSSGKWWYAKSGSSYAVGWEKIDSSWYYFDSAGWMKTGWQKVGGNWYYLQGSGAMVTGWNRVSGTWYYHNNSGAMLTGWQSINGTWYYLENSGAMAADKWVGDYYLTSSGAMATNQWIGDYWVGPDGKWDPNETYENSIYLNPDNYPTYGDIDYSSDADMYDDVWIPESDNAVVVDSNATSANNAKPGDIVVFVPTNENPTGSALKVTNVTTQGSQTRIEGTTPELSEVVDSIRATGVTNQFVSLQLADGVTMSDATSGQTLASEGASYGLFDINTSNTLTLDTFGLDGKIIDKDGLQLTLDPQIYYDIDYRNGELRTCTAIAKVSAELNYEMKVSEKYETKLFSATIVIPEALGLTMNMDFYLTASATGSVELEGRLTSAAGIVYSNGAVQTVSSKGFSYFANFDADVRAGFAPRIGFNVFGVIPLAQVDAEMGVGVEGRFTDHNGFQCADLNAYVYADVYLNRKSNALGEALDLLDQPTEFHPLTKSNGSIGKIHVENGEVVPECTWGKETTQPIQPTEPWQPSTPPEGLENEDFIYKVEGSEAHIIGLNPSKYKIDLADKELSILNLAIIKIPGYIDGYKVKSVDLSGCMILGRLLCYYTEVTSINLAGCQNLYDVDCGYSELVSLNVTNCPKLRGLGCLGNSLTTLDLSGCPKLEMVFCGSNKLTSLDLSGCPELMDLDCRSNQLTRIKLPSSSALCRLYCSDNYLTTLDLTGCPNVSDLRCDSGVNVIGAGIR